MKVFYQSLSSTVKSPKILNGKELWSTYNDYIDPKNTLFVMVSAYDHKCDLGVDSQGFFFEFLFVSQ